MEGLGLAPWLSKLCRKFQLLEPTEIQKKAIPQVLAGRHVLGASPTGSGKTACFMLPIIQAFSREAGMFFSLVVLPTRELAMQVLDQFALFGSAAGMRPALIVGGMNLTDQKLELSKGVHVIVGTPGRLLDMALDSSLENRFKRFRFLVLDECDRLLSEGFGGDVGQIYRLVRRKTPSQQQVLLFSATVQKITDSILREQLGLSDVVTIDLSDLEKDLHLDHYFIMCPKVSKIHLIHYLLNEHQIFKAPHRGIIFARSIEECELLTRILNALGLDVCSLHALQDRKLRHQSLLSFRVERSRVLIATNVAARGLDLPLINWVINTSVPSEYDVYCHRVGRCGRAGREGTALTLVCPTLVCKNQAVDAETCKIKAIESQLKRDLLCLQVDLFETQKYVHRIATASAEAKLQMEHVGFTDKLKTLTARRKGGKGSIKRLRVE
eukprot:Protomagalhaensia_sp_Gyna_25__1370@NODE_1690_length_1616_cov_46_670894_g1384_i0_p1_GENE_NODE_1690_length_1616_cov_46_670894_g1384_i0NODE_1690_length_1616_cov_46_670894_g1384_i0_p1_ORF_typecomplete_len439_score85_94DEAD/PF00270_29/7_6e49Helicase_C/PF00271_31/2_8e03Helicase_C/PF00271_31/5_8e02Helicase_C/PF00271_31/1_7e22Helicase_C/PF00271_31/5_8e03ResIII/PF04851_15/1_2e13ERCC3_RAD25_C/PF16203_5/9_1e02ERCC3_RAD25_C/PF16203_5/2_4e07Flavi_DEAD/PF07652_14/0_019CMS1/PF14617_6/0_03T4SSDNA_transf/PF02534